jgi:hypothetical protein
MIALWQNGHSLVTDRFEVSYLQLSYKIDSSHCHPNLRQHKHYFQS